MKSISIYLHRFFAPNSIRNKLFLMVAMFLVAAMLLVYIANAFLTIKNELDKAHSELQLLTEVIGHNLEATLLLKDENGASDVLDNLRANPNIIAAEVRSPQNKVLVRFYQAEPKSMMNSVIHRLLPVPKTISLNSPIRTETQLLGTLSIEASLNDMWSLLLIQLAQLAAVMVSVLLLGTFFIKRASKLIVEPIDKVAFIAKEITSGGNYALRVPTGAADEVGEMASALNMMLSEIEHRDQELRIAAVAFESQEGMLVTDVNEVILRVNHAFTEMTGYSAEEVVGQTPRILQYGLQDAAFFADVRARIEASGSWQGEVQSRKKNGEVYTEWLSITAVMTKAGVLTNFVATMVDITERKATEEKITQLAFYDSLTLLPNRRLLLERLSQRLISGSRNTRHGALMFIDLDKFKVLNDTLGHHIGDLLLQQVGQRLLNSVREADTVARLGGDEFVILLNDLSADAAEALVQAKALGTAVLLTLSQTYQLAHFEHQGTGSIGMTIFSGDQLTADEIMQRADVAMYRAKRAGRNNLHIAEQPL
jgi:diguanylate cyclase (GGDEF)-like protein/PAS domain S-box-containing protein